jgi:hypothetical protein
VAATGKFNHIVHWRGRTDSRQWYRHQGGRPLDGNNYENKKWQWL